MATLVVGPSLAFNDYLLPEHEDEPVSIAEPNLGLERPERLTVIAPKRLRPQSDYHVLVTLANSTVPVSIDLSLTGGLDSNREQIEAKSILIASGETQTIKFTIGDWPQAQYILNVSALAVDRSWNFTKDQNLEYQAKTFSILIQTDKAIYKPGQEVKFRAISLSQTLAPMVLKNEINVTITDPKRNIIKQWLGLSNYRGLLTLSLQLSQDPMIGFWNIKVESRGQSAVKDFQVAEYILPTFDVKISLPSYATYKQPDIVASVQASYTYGKPVNGMVALSIQPQIRYSFLSTSQLETRQFKARLVNGKADFQLDLIKDLGQKTSKDYGDMLNRKIEFFALVEEELTGRKYNKTESLVIYDREIKIDHVDETTTFKPGLEHQIQLKVAYQDDTPVEDNGPELVIRLQSHGKLLNMTRCIPIAGLCEASVYIPKDTKVSSIVESKSKNTYLVVEVTYRKEIFHLSPMEAIKTASDQFMQISLPQFKTIYSRFGKPTRKRSIDVNEDLKVQVQATEPMLQVTCQGMARGDIVWALSRDAKNQSEFEFNAKVDQRMTPEAQILCFYVRPQNKELIADSVKFQVSGLIKNAVKLTTNRDEAKPGQEVEVSVLTKPNSLVGVLGIDQSVLLLRKGNDITQNDLTNEIKSYGLAKRDFWNRATDTESLLDASDVVVITNNLVHIEFRGSYGISYFKSDVSSRLVSLVNSDENYDGVDNDDPPRHVALSSPQLAKTKKETSEPLVIRSSFPETWIWENATVGQDGFARFKAKVPDTITSWVLSGFSLNEDAGFGLSDAKTSVRVFRPFFIKLNLPYSIIRGEVVNIQAVVFNYGKREVSATVTMENKNDDFEFVEASNDIDDEKLNSSQSESRQIRIPPQDGSSVSFLVKPRKVGQIEIRIIARSDLASDGISKRLLVRPEGQTQYFNKAILIDLPGPRSTETHNVSIQVPPNAVADSHKVAVSAIGDIMGPGLSNVDDLLRLPYGCGEQNMINLVPNIVIMNYLQSSKRLKDAQRVRAIRNIESGYQRELNYKRNDGSFSAFGNNDKTGSVWLTAYVLKSFQQARSLISVDEKVISRAANFIAKYSKPDGSIEELGMLHDKRLQSASASGSSIYLTAYSMIALLQRSIQPDPESIAPVALDDVTERGLNYIEKHLSKPSDQISTYDLAIGTYALQLANRRESMNQAYEMLWSRVHDNGEGLNWWTNEDKSTSIEVGEIEGSSEKLSNPTSTPQPPLKPIPENKIHSSHLFLPDSLAVEMTALSLMSTVKSGQMERAFPIVRWLIEHQNSNGGFASTQDTVLAIEALAMFASASVGSKAAPSIDIELTYPRKPTSKSSDIRRNNVDEILITPSNSLVNQQTQLPDNLTWVQIQASGSGAAVVQVSWQYNLQVSAEKPAFYLNPIVDKASTIDYLQLSVCTFYKAGDSSNMAVVEVDLPSGYVADNEALPSLRRTKEIKRIDTSEGDTKIQIYLDRVTKEEICFTVPAHRTTKVSNNKPVPVIIYDYYNRHHAARIFYEPLSSTSCDICDAGNCDTSCSNKPKRSERLVSLHEQRRLSSLSRQNNANQRSANLTATQPNGSPNDRKQGATNLLPLAPVMMSIFTLVGRVN